MVDSWQAHRAAIPWVVARQQFNLLTSHVVTRIISHVGGDSARNLLAVGLQMTYLGVPSIYYGDEIGLAGERGQTRACMQWEQEAWDHELRAFYRQLVGLRRSSHALIEGGFQVLSVEENVIAFLRDTDDEQIIVVGNRGPESRSPGPLPVAHGAVPDAAEFIEFFGGAKSVVTDGQLPLPALPAGVTVWISSTGGSAIC